MTIDLAIKNGLVWLENTGLVRVGIAVEDGIIAGIGKESVLPKPRREIDATGLIVIPGIIDSHIHLRDPGFTYKEDVETGTRAAAAGGVTTVIDMPNVNPVPNTAERFRAHRENASRKALVDYGHWASPTVVEEIPKIAAEGAVGFKFFMISQKYPYDNPEQFLYNPYEIYQVLGEIAKTGLPCMVHPWHQEMWLGVRDEYIKAGKTTLLDYYKAKRTADNFLEASMDAMLLLLAKTTACRLWLLHNNWVPLIDFVRKMKAAGYEAVFEQNPWAVFQAQVDPIEGEDEKWRALMDGTITVIGTDHSPHSKEEVAKSKVDAFNSIGTSAPSVEHYLAMYLTEVNTKGRISLDRLVELFSVNVAKELGLYPKKGTIQIGSDADLTLVDMEREEIIDEKNLYTKCGLTPFAGKALKGMPVTTIVRGTPVMENREIVGKPGFGKFINPLKER